MKTRCDPVSRPLMQRVVCKLRGIRENSFWREKTGSHRRTWFFALMQRPQSPGLARTKTARFVCVAPLARNSFGRTLCVAYGEQIVSRSLSILKIS